jgi:hypothetical protein
VEIARMKGDLETGDELAADATEHLDAANLHPTTLFSELPQVGQS